MDNFEDIENLKELNDLNTELYKNNIKEKKFKKFFIPEQEGEYNIKLKYKIIIKDFSYMFAGFYKIVDINFNSFNSKDIIDMKYMFYNYENLKSVNLFSFNSLNVSNMEFMFYNV